MHYRYIEDSMQHDVSSNTTTSVINTELLENRTISVTEKKSDSVMNTLPKKQGLYDPSKEHDACGVGFVAHIKGEKSHNIVQQGLTILKRVTHRGAVGADPKAGDGAGLLMQIPDAFFQWGWYFYPKTAVFVLNFKTSLIALSRKSDNLLLVGEKSLWMPAV